MSIRWLRSLRALLRGFAPQGAAVEPRPAQAAAEAVSVLMTDAKLASLIRSFAAARGYSESYAARVATGSGDTLDRIERGGTLTLHRANIVVAKISSLWPADLPWPADIPRPCIQDIAP